eukprot:6182081-Pleurochrysis_carterae.AAC.2
MDSDLPKNRENADDEIIQLLRDRIGALHAHDAAEEDCSVHWLAWPRGRRPTALVVIIYLRNEVVVKEERSQTLG